MRSEARVIIIRSLGPILLILGLAMAIHIDWHVARTGLGFSLGWPYHWVLAIPIFALASWYTVRRWPERPLAAGLASIAVAALLAQVAEPLGESVWHGLPLDQGFRAERLGAFGAFVGVGMAVFSLMAWWLSRRPEVE